MLRSAMGAPDWKRKLTAKARKYILAHPKSTIAEVMRKCDVSAATVTSLRRELREEGLGRRYPHTPSEITTGELFELGDRPEATATPPADTEAILSGTARMSREKRLNMLEAIMRAGTPDQTIRANAEIEKMERQTAEVDDALSLLAPGTLDEAIADAADVVEALLDWGGEKAAESAFKTAHSRWRQTAERLERQEAKLTLQPGASNGTDPGPAVVDPPVANADPDRAPAV